MTWGQFKEFVELRGVCDEMEVTFIDCDLSDSKLEVEMNEKTFSCSIT
jgi:hypothetical protein